MLDIKLIQSELNKIAERHNLSFVILFGSQATGRIHSKSDVDIAVISKDMLDKYKIIDDFENLFKRNDIEVVNLSNASPTLMYCVVRDGKLLYEKKDGIYDEWKLYAMRIWRETSWLRDLRDKKMVEQVKAIV